MFSLKIESLSYSLFYAMKAIIKQMNDSYFEQFLSRSIIRCFKLSCCKNDYYTWLLSFIYFQMKQEKVFVRYKNFNETQPHNRDREVKKPMGDKKKYAQKPNKVREASRQIIDAFEQLDQIPNQVSALVSKFSKFFNEKSRIPEKDHNQLLNDYVIFNAKKFIESLNFPKKEPEPHQSSSDPDWNSDEDIDGNMKSKEIDSAVIEKVEEKFADHPIKKQPLLKRHEKEFLEDYFRAKRIQEQQENEAKAAQNIKPAQEQKRTSAVINGNTKAAPKQVNNIPQQTEKTVTKPKNIWSEYQEKQVNSFVDMGFMTKLNDNDEDIEAELAQDDGMFNDDEMDSLKQEEEQKSQEDSEGDDDIFGDQTPSTTVKASKPSSEPKIESQKTMGQGVVVINTQIFSKIAQSVGLLPARCNWIISNEKEKYKVSTDYMDIYYRKENICDILPYISLNHSEFVRNQDVESSHALDIFRKFNSRKEKKYQYSQGRGVKNQYKEKVNTHHKK